MANNPDLEAVFERDEPAFVPYLAAGDPSYEASLEYVEALARGGADVIELGLPFSEPIAEGKTIQNAIVRALEGGMTPDRFFEFVEDLDVDVPLVCMTYYNLIYQYGEEDGPRPFVEKAAEVGLTGFVVPDLPAEEADPLREACDEFDLDLVFIVAPTTRGDRLDRMREQVSGYVYVQARLGTTGARDDVSDQTDESLARIDDWDVPKAVGFGIKEGDHAARIVRAGADGIIVGSALVDIVAEHHGSAGSQTESGNVAEGYENDDPVSEVADRLETKARELKAGALRGADQRTETVSGDDR
ncbi:tryptophan synthase subunit alpha [Halorientalis sp. IM1011]|uniref:tryptophan synthase subunit alpha n=1 Tax=Halorientalis sp. IM1011 TaxID=1932360 RepID=UPI00097CCF2E|nr:tryptophan synthase subunit alpha [Halorientalis sp. IM1011]AQL42045.1 tryptophan synthase subunit alpha [Halorientalis sp. IM1011]